MSILVNVVKELHGSALVPHLEDELSSGTDSVLLLVFAPQEIDFLSSSPGPYSTSSQQGLHTAPPSCTSLRS